MSQTAVNAEPGQAYEGKVHVSGSFPTSFVSRIANELIYFGKLVVPLTTGELAVGGAAGGPQSVKLPTTAADVLLAKQGGGIAIADPSIERLSVNGVAAAYGAYPAEDALSVMRKGQIWVVVETALLDLSLPVFVRVATPGGTPPAASLGSFSPVDTGADFEPAPEGLAWLGAAAVGAVNFALLSVNLPA
jgi:hypothetical protein